MTVDETRLQVAALMKRAHKLWGNRCGQAPHLDFSLRGKSAGQARRGQVRLNQPLLDQHPDQWVPTLIHEVSHVLTMRLHPGSRPHGPQWRAINHALGGVDEVRHRMDTTDHGVRRTRYFEYQTASGKRVWLSSIRHRRAQKHLRKFGYTGYQVYRGGDAIVEWTGNSELRVS